MHFWSSTTAPPGWRNGHDGLGERTSTVTQASRRILRGTFTWVVEMAALVSWMASMPWFPSMTPTGLSNGRIPPPEPTVQSFMEDQWLMLVATAFWLAFIEGWLHSAQTSFSRRVIGI